MERYETIKVHRMKRPIHIQTYTNHKFQWPTGKSFLETCTQITVFFSLCGIGLKIEIKRRKLKEETEQKTRIENFCKSSRR